MNQLTFLNLAPSPNNIKVRIALAMKGLPYEMIPVPFDDRSIVIEKSGQPLTPVLLDGDKVILDSFGIMRYLDANFAGPRLYPDTREGIRAVETWENFTRNGLQPAFGMILGMALSGQADKSIGLQAERIINQLALRIEDTLADQPFLTGQEPNAADLSAGSFMSYSVLNSDEQEDGSLPHFFSHHLHLSPRLEKTRAWVGRVMALESEAKAKA